MTRALVFALVFASGCGASSLRTHATIGAIAASALATSEIAIVDTCRARRDACAGGLACVESVRASCVDAAAAQDATRDVVSVYLDAIEIAALADDGRVAEALAGALVAAQSAWAALGRTLGELGISLPSIGGAL